MRSIIECRTDIHEYFRTNKTCQGYFRTRENYEDFVAYEVSLLLLQDSTESLWQHRQNGFSQDPMMAYIEFWGVMQATSIQQDAISELYKVILQKPLIFHKSDLENWDKVRTLRHVSAGHPARKQSSINGPITRTFMGRGFGSYDSIRYETWQQGVGTSFPEINLGALLDAYESEAASKLREILGEMKRRWP